MHALLGLRFADEPGPVEIARAACVSLPELRERAQILYPQNKQPLMPLIRELGMSHGYALHLHLSRPPALPPEMSLALDAIETSPEALVEFGRNAGVDGKQRAATPGHRRPAQLRRRAPRNQCRMCVTGRADGSTTALTIRTGRRGGGNDKCNGSSRRPRRSGSSRRTA